jgi:LDH2 family malate/lactate/ureidoglycolate dehydrogenase
MYLGSEELRQFLVEVFTAAGLTEGDSAAVAENIIEAELRGVTSHGLTLVPLYIKRLKGGAIRTRYLCSIISERGAALLIDGDGGPGQAIMQKAIRMIDKRIGKLGAMFASIRNSNHVGMLATYSRLLAERGLISLVMTNTGPSIALPGKGSPRVGNNAWCVGVPGAEQPVIIDMAAGTVACGKVRYADLHQQPIPEGWLLDANGCPTLNPKALDTGGAVTALGGYKGIALSCMIDMLTAVPAAGTASPNVVRQRLSNSSPTAACQSILALDPAAFGGQGRVIETTETLLGALRSTGTDPDLHRVAPGDRETQRTVEQRKHGIAITPKVWQIVEAIAESTGVPTPEVQFQSKDL